MSENTFAKLYETELGQILVKQDEGEDGAEVRIFFKPEGCGVCTLALSWGDDDSETQWSKADSVFNNVTEESATNLVRDTMNKMGI